MRGSEFLNAVRGAMPTQAELEEYGLDPEEIDGIQASFLAPAREALAGDLAAKSELERMLLEYDCSRVEVGLVRFLPEPELHPYGVLVAFCEAEPVLVEASGKVAMYDHADPDPGHSMQCAADSERFLDALSLFVGMVRERSQWKGRVVEAADLCADKAGGSDYTTFFRMLCGGFR